MNWNRQELKRNGKAAMKRSYWSCVLVAFILGLLSYAERKTAKGGGSGSIVKELQEVLSSGQIAALIGGVTVISIILAILIDMFIKNMLVVGGARFFINNSRYQKGELSDLIDTYKDGHFLNIFITMLLRDLFLALWAMLLIVPGIVKAYAYRQVPYILAEHPDMDPMEAIRQSKEMMRGQKWNTFVLDLSFLGWKILSTLTFGILGALYVDPYIQATGAELYLTLRR